MTEVITYIAIVLYSVAILLNGLGIYLLTSCRPLSNSKFLLTNLAVTEIVPSGIYIVFSCGIRGISSVFGVTVGLAYYSAIFFLTIDRLIATRFPLKYRVLITKKRLKLAIGTALILEMIIGVSSVLWPMFLTLNMWIVLDVTFIVLCVLTYGYIFTKIFLRRRFDNNGQERNEGRRQRLMMNRERKFVKIAGLIIFSFVLLILMPDIILHQYASNWVGILFPIGIVADPVIYIFVQDDLRSLLKRRVFRRNDGIAPAQQEIAL